MESSKAETNLLPPELHERLARLAEQRGTSLVDLVRKACEAEYGPASSSTVETRLEAIRELASLSLPVGDPSEMEQESVPGPDELLPLP